MQWLRWLAILLGASLMIGEAYRSWGAGRPIAFWMDDMIMGSALIAAAVLVRRERWTTRAFFTGAWGLNAGMLYGSFFGKVFTPEDTNSGNFNADVLTALVGLAFVTAVTGFLFSLRVPFKGTTP